MAAQILFDGGSVVFDCDGNIVFCDPTADTWLCCLSCGEAGNGSSFNVVVPCGALDATFSGIDQDDPPTTACDPCTDLNTTYELSQISCENWFGDFDETEPCPLLTFDMEVELRVCCPGDGNIYLYVHFEMNLGVGGVMILNKILATETDDGSCYFYDWSNPNEVLSCATHDATICDGFETGRCLGPSGANCDFTGASVTLTPA